jgi:hypothetical protein
MDGNCSSTQAESDEGIGGGLVCSAPTDCQRATAWAMLNIDDGMGPDAFGEALPK